MTPQEIQTRFEGIGTPLSPCEDCMKTFQASESVCPHCGFRRAPLVLQRMDGTVDDERAREMKEFFSRKERD